MSCTVASGYEHVRLRSKIVGHMVEALDSATVMPRFPCDSAYFGVGVDALLPDYGRLRTHGRHVRLIAAGIPMAAHAHMTLPGADATTHVGARRPAAPNGLASRGIVRASCGTFIPRPGRGTRRRVRAQGLSSGHALN